MYLCGRGKECSEVPKRSNIPRHSVTVPKLARVSSGISGRTGNSTDTRVNCGNCGTVTEWRGILPCSGTSEHSFPFLHLSSSLTFAKVVNCVYTYTVTDSKLP